MIALLLLLVMKSGVASVADWSITFENKNLCSLRGSSVVFNCSYNYPDDETVWKTVWVKGEAKDGKWIRTELSSLSSYQSRAEYVGDQQHNCSLVIHDLQDNDTGQYSFRFDTNKFGRRAKNYVYLSITGLKARVYPTRVTVGDTVTFECGTVCALSSIVWFKDGRPAAKPESQVQAKDAGKYSCAIRGQESVQSDPVALDIQYPPLNVSIEVSPPGHLTQGSSVNLKCISDANPAAHNYTWYTRSTSPSSSPVLELGSGPVLSLFSVETSHTGLYVCRARNRLGENNSTEVLLTVDATDNDSLILLVGLGVILVLVLFLFPLLIVCICRLQSAKKEEEELDYENIAAT